MQPESKDILNYGLRFHDKSLKEMSDLLSALCVCTRQTSSVALTPVATRPQVADCFALDNGWRVQRAAPCRWQLQWAHTGNSLEWIGQLLETPQLRDHTNSPSADLAKAAVVDQTPASARMLATSRSADLAKAAVVDQTPASARMLANSRCADKAKVSDVSQTRASARLLANPRSADMAKAGGVDQTTDKDFEDARILSKSRDDGAQPLVAACRTPGPPQTTSSSKQSWSRGRA